MQKINWARVILGGIVAGAVWNTFDSVIGYTVGKDFMLAVPGGILNPPSAGMMAFNAADGLVMGIFAIWLYAAIRPRYGAGPKTAVIAGFAWWLITTCVDAVWASFRFVPPSLVWPASAAALPSLIIAALAGAWVYRE